MRNTPTCLNFYTVIQYMLNGQNMVYCYVIQNMVHDINYIKYCKTNVQWSVWLCCDTNIDKLIYCMMLLRTCLLFHSLEADTVRFISDLYGTKYFCTFKIHFFILYS